MSLSEHKVIHILRSCPVLMASSFGWLQIETRRYWRVFRCCGCTYSGSSCSEADESRICPHCWFPFCRDISKVFRKRCRVIFIHSLQETPYYIGTETSRVRRARYEVVHNRKQSFNCSSSLCHVICGTLELCSVYIKTGLVQMQLLCHCLT